MKPKQYIVTASNPGTLLFEGQIIQPYHEDDHEIIVSVSGQNFDHHIRKHGAFFATHLKPVGGQ